MAAVQPGNYADPDDGVVRSLTGHVTVEMQSHYSHIGLDEQRQAVRAVLTLVPLGEDDDNHAPGGDRGGDRPLSAPHGA